MRRNKEAECEPEMHEPEFSRLFIATRFSCNVKMSNTENKCLRDAETPVTHFTMEPLHLKLMEHSKTRSNVNTNAFLNCHQ